MDIDFECSYYYHKQDINGFLEQLTKSAQSPGPADRPAYIFHGRWGYDGAAEHYVVRPEGGLLADASYKEGPLTHCELITDGSLTAYHYLDPEASILYVGADRVAFPFVGPLTWCMTKRFDLELVYDYARAKVQRVKASWRGYPTEVEIYDKVNGDYRLRREVWYDPAMGYLPRFYRGIVYGGDNGKSEASVREVYVTDARLCSAGGFVPTEWYCHMYNIDDFSSLYPSYDHTTKLSASADSTLVRFHTLAFADRKTAVRLEHLEGVDRAFAPGGHLEFKGTVSPMTISDLKTKLGAKAKVSNRPLMANIDVLEENEFAAGSGSWIPAIYIIGGLVAALILVVLAVARRRFTALIILVVILSSSGCHRERHEQVPRISLAMTPSPMLYDPSQSQITVTLEATNSGSAPLQVYNINAGCWCRKVDTSHLPARIDVGETLDFAVSMGGSQQHDPQRYIITLETDLGNLTAPVDHISFPTHHVSPPSVTLSGLYEGQESDDGESFEVVHREVFAPGESRQEGKLKFPPEFSVTQVASRSGKISFAPQYTCTDTTYRARLLDSRVGLFRQNIELLDSDGHHIIDVPVVWNRVPFCSSAPSRVVLSARPVRTFLVCPDAGVELARVLASPTGVRAVLSSPREVTVSLTDDAPSIIDGYIELETTAEKQTSLRIPVVRYSNP